MEVTQDRFLNGQVTARQPKHGYRAAIDPVLLAAAVTAKAGQAVLELGCGVGVSLLCLCARTGPHSAVGLELQPELAELARVNAHENSQPITIFDGDISDPPPPLRQMQFHHILANPPYRQGASHVAPRGRGKSTAVIEEVPLSAWTDLAARRLKPKGTLTMILPPARIADFLKTLPPYLGGIAVKPIYPRADAEAGRLIIRAVKDSRARLRLAKGMILHTADGAFSPETEKLLRDGAGLEF
ncbi:MAG: methyltransferase [Rhodobacteraceae bacterium]|nr:methyltransferase [Paracoccaceae bacterium]